jgi:hypothetical protein
VPLGKSHIGNTGSLKRAQWVGSGVFRRRPHRGRKRAKSFLCYGSLEKLIASNTISVRLKGFGLTSI